MASTYGILTISTLNNIITYDLTSYTDNAGTTRLYSDESIEAKITLAEEIVFGAIHRTYTLTDIPVNVFWGIKEMSRIYMTNQLIFDGYIKGITPFNEMLYFASTVEPRIQNEEKQGAIADAEGVDDYTYG